MKYQSKLEKAGFKIIWYSTKITAIKENVEFFICDKNKTSKNYEPEFKHSFTQASKMGLI